VPSIAGCSPGLAKVLIYVKRIILEFIGGSWDGMNLCTFSADGLEAGLAIGTCAKTGDGTPGREVVMPADYAVYYPGRGRKYVVVHRVEVRGEVLVRLQCFQETQVVPPPEPATVPVTLQFAGGPLDQVTLDSRSPDCDEVLAVVACFLLTDGGTIGAHCPSTMGSLVLRRKRLHGAPSTRPALDHEYRVVRRTEHDECIAVELRYSRRNCA
jgi:hypothetical protein